jgi:hypothetical protein
LKVALPSVSACSDFDGRRLKAAYGEVAPSPRYSEAAAAEVAFLDPPPTPADLKALAAAAVHLA